MEEQGGGRPLDPQDSPTGGKAGKHVSNAAQLRLAEAGQLEVAGRWAECLVACDAALASAPSSAYGWGMKGHALLELGHPEEAATSFERAVALAPTDAGKWHNLALTYAQLSRFDEALEASGRSLAFDPSWSPGWHLKSELLTTLDRYEEALAAADEALALQQDGREGGLNWQVRAMALYGLKRLPEALEAIDRALALLPDRWRLAMLKSTILRAQRRPVESLRWRIRATEGRLRERREGAATRSDASADPPGR